jgi:hypothetical protein
MPQTYPRSQDVMFDFNGVLLWDADWQVQSWQVIGKRLRGGGITDEELAVYMHGRPNVPKSVELGQILPAPTPE